MPSTCSVRLLGGFLVEVDGRPVPPDAWRHRRGADLVKLLALSSHHRLHREQLMARLWPGLEPAAAAANLRKAVHYARRGMGRQEAIGAEGDMLTLWPSGELTVDVKRVESEAARALATRTGLQAAADLFTGDLLPEDRYAEWTEPRRQLLRDRLLELLRAAGRWDRVLELDRTDEEACRAVMQTQLEAGNRGGAIRAFQRLREILRVDLGVGPEPSTVVLFERAVAMEGPTLPGPSEQAQSLLARGLVHWNRRELDSAERLAEEARLFAAENHLGRELGEASALLGMVALTRGRWLERFRHAFTEAIALSADEAPFVLDAHVCLAEASLASADSGSVAALAHELLPLAVEADSAPGEALMSLLIGESELFSGRLDESTEWLSRTADLYQGLGARSGRAFALVRLAEVAVALGRRVNAERHLAAARRLAASSELASHLMVRVFAGLLQVAEGPERSRRVIAEAEVVLRPKEVCEPCSIGFRVRAAIASARSGDPAGARRWLADAERLAGMWQGGPWQAAVWEARAVLRLASGESAQGAALLREAAALFAESGRPLDEARCIAATAP